MYAASQSEGNQNGLDGRRVLVRPSGQVDVKGHPVVRAKVATHELGQVLLGAAAFRLLWVEPSAGESQPSTEALRGTDAIPSAD